MMVSSYDKMKQSKKDNIVDISEKFLLKIYA